MAAPFADIQQAHTQEGARRAVTKGRRRQLLYEVGRQAPSSSIGAFVTASSHDRGIDSAVRRRVVVKQNDACPTSPKRGRGLRHATAAACEALWLASTSVLRHLYRHPRPELRHQPLRWRVTSYRRDTLSLVGASSDGPFGVSFLAPRARPPIQPIRLLPKTRGIFWQSRYCRVRVQLT